MRCKLSYLFVVFILFWIWLMFNFMKSSWKSVTEGDDSSSTFGLQRRLKEAQNEVERLSRENIHLSLLAKNCKDPGGVLPAMDTGNEPPSIEYETTRRLIRRNVNEMWRFISFKLKGMERRAGKKKEDVSEIKNTRDTLLSYYLSIIVYLDRLTEVDGFGKWRIRESKEVSDIVQNRFQTIQNPGDCHNARKLICNLNKGCGYGCQIHHAIYCFLSAYGTRRTLILRSKGWRYDRTGFEDVFKPLSKTCPSIPDLKTGESAAPRSFWPGLENTINVDIPVVDSVNPKPRHLPPNIPKDISDRIIRLHGDPAVWWVSEILYYLLRPQPDLETLLKNAEGEKLPKDDSPFVGVHIRRTDKVGTEAAFHPVEEYMEYVEERFRYLDILHSPEVEKVPRRVYVASDDPKVLIECRKKFPEYSFFGDATVARSAAISSRYTSNSLKGVITDIYLLSLSDYLVCTFSSQVCRMAYELLQKRHVDAYDRFKSLDDIWYFGGQDEHLQEIVLPHIPKSRDELDLKVGDVIEVAGNHWNGFNKGKNRRTGKVGLYPEYKTKEKHRAVEFPDLKDFN